MNPLIAAVVAPLDRIDVATDAILPKQFMRSIEKSGYGSYLFDNWRYLESGELGERREGRPLNPDFVLNQPRYRNAGALLCRRNFGSGSAREHGFRVLIALSFGEIFSINCYKNRLLPIVLPGAEVDHLFTGVSATPGYELTVDLTNQIVRTPQGELLPFEIDAFRKRCLLEDLDEIVYALSHAQLIRDFEACRRAEAPWVFNVLSE